MAETPAATQPETASAALPTELTLQLIVRDPEVIAELCRHAEGPQRDTYALSALRLGVLALRQASGQLDAASIRQEGERLMSSVRELLSQQLTTTSTTLSETLKRYFDPASGELPQRLERLLRKDGELETMLARQFSGDDSMIAKTLARHVGENSPLFKILSPNQTDGLLASLTKCIGDALAAQREQILRQFSLDDKESALSRLVTELTGSNGKLRDDLLKDLTRVREEFSLDNENGALARLVSRVEKAQSLINAQFSMDNDSSALSRMSRLLEQTNKVVSASLTLDDEKAPLYRLRRELLQVVESLSKSNQEFQTEVRETLAALKARRQESERSTSHGLDFEAAVGAVLQREAQRLGDIYHACGNEAGELPRCKVGDHLIVLGQDSAAPDARVVCETKADASYGMLDARREIEVARKNRQAQAGIFVFDRRTAPEGCEPISRQGCDVFVVWDPDDASTDVLLKAALWIARALVIRECETSQQSAADFAAIDTAMHQIAQQMEALGEIQTWANTIRNNGDKIMSRAEKVRANLEKQLDTLREHITALRPARSGASAA